MFDRIKRETARARDALHNWHQAISEQQDAAHRFGEARKEEANSANSLRQALKIVAARAQGNDYEEE